MSGARNLEVGSSANHLALAVLQQAVRDAFHATLKAQRTGGAAAVTPTERDEALHFLQATDGGWAMARRTWCDMAGVEPGWLERQVVQRVI